MNNDNTNHNNVLVDAKKEYTEQFISLVSPFMYQGTLSMYEVAKNMYKEAKNSNPQLPPTVNHFKIFQEEVLRKTPKWNKDTIENETKRIISGSGWNRRNLESLLKSVFSSNMNLLLFAGKIEKKHSKKKKKKNKCHRSEDGRFHT